MVFSKVGPNQSIEWGQIKVSKSVVAFVRNLGTSQAFSRAESFYVIPDERKWHKGSDK